MSDTVDADLDPYLMTRVMLFELAAEEADERGISYDTVGQTVVPGADAPEEADPHVFVAAAASVLVTMHEAAKLGDDDLDSSEFVKDVVRDFNTRRRLSRTEVENPDGEDGDE